MNRCKNFGDRRQGRDCPARAPATTATPTDDHSAEDLYDDTGLLLLQGLALVAFVVSMVAFISLYVGA